jgi:hypothetical protein
MFLALILNVTKEVFSFNIMASTFLGNANKSVSKQAMHTAMSKNAFIDFIDEIFNELIQTKLGISNLSSSESLYKIAPSLNSRKGYLKSILELRINLGKLPMPECKSLWIF